jgi:hypothetical protein
MANINAPHYLCPWAREQHNNTPASTHMDQRVDGLPLVSIDIVREEIVGTFRDKLRVNMCHGGSVIGGHTIADSTMTNTHKG